MFFADLDRTLIYSADALELGGPDHANPRLLCVETQQGRPGSFITERAATGLASLTKADLLVPVTTRSIEQYRRVHLPGQEPELALVAHGGRLLRAGQVDEDFSREVAARLEEAVPLDEARDGLLKRAEQPFVLKVREVEGLFLYTVVDLATTSAAWLEELHWFAEDIGWSFSVQGRKTYLIPGSLSKCESARLLASELGLQETLASGDASTDETLLRMASRGIVPAHGDLAVLRWPRRIQITRHRGVKAGEEIIEWACAELGASLNE